MSNTVPCPTTGTLAAGHDTMGMMAGASLPAELAAWNPLASASGTMAIQTALVFFNSQFSTGAASTKPQVKYAGTAFGVGTASDGTYLASLLEFVAWCVNPHASATAILVATRSVNYSDITGLGGAGNTGLAIQDQWVNIQNNRMITLGQDDVQGDSILEGFAVTQATPMWQLYSNITFSGTDGSTATGQLVTLDNLGAATSETPS